LAERFDRLEEQLAIVTGMWGTPEGETFGFAGKHYTIVDSPALPKPVQRPHPPIIVGGGGPRRTPALAARFATEFNLAFPTLDFTRLQLQRVRTAVRDAGRDPDELIYSAAFAVCAGRDALQRSPARSRSCERTRR
jgi:alkanesulfonate monooxygenase SsuD/methylene tetrahydromethanopterin reductase-like flavin-dependent oxidoreductase (luciferase family)